MNYIQPQSRGQVEMTSMDMLISSDNEVRVLDAFVEKLEMEKLGFSLHVKDEGRPLTAERNMDIEHQTKRLMTND